jgi:hypothetical protein
MGANATEPCGYVVVVPGAVVVVSVEASQTEMVIVEL